MTLKSVSLIQSIVSHLITHPDDPDGKITVVKIIQIREILTDGVFHIASNSRLVLLSKYKLVFYSDQPRYNLQNHRPVLTLCCFNKAETGQNKYTHFWL
ncbi:hypothetical protein VP01_512g2 [Puccinia sorghi]|uniref:Uncharacterized protein n=1 Tax=Puccinia sorghi TaxID=27349 RepID=A0A0L6UL26_9BASI|nr:hypothetical protein VP01_512g2 [Puccinia sorghi]